MNLNYNPWKIEFSSLSSSSSSLSLYIYIYIYSVCVCAYIYIYKTDKIRRKATSWHKSSQIFG